MANKPHKQQHPNRQKKGGGNPQRKNSGKGNDGLPWYAAPPTAKQAWHMANAAAKKEAMPVENTLKGNIRASNQRVKDVGNWWDQYLNTVSGAQAETQAAYDAAGAQNLAQMSQASALDTANTQRLTGEEAKSAALRGVAPTGEAASRDAAAQAQRNDLSAAYGSTTAQRGANQFAYLANERRIGAGQKVKAKVDELKRTRSLQQELRNARKERGAAATQKFGEEKTTYLENALKEKAFNLDKSEAAQKAAQAAREAAQRERENKEDNAQDENASRRGAHKDSGGLTPSQKRDARREQHNANVAARNLYNSAGRPSYDKHDWDLLVQRLAMEDGIDYTAAQRAVEKLRKKVNAGSEDPNGASLGH